VTPLEHVVRDYEEGPSRSARFHFEEWVTVVDERASSDFLIKKGESVAFRLWRSTDSLDLLHCCKSLSFPLELEAFHRNTFEFVVIVRKTEAEPCQLESASTVDGLAR
jgi:hypothetical protein